VEPLGKKLERSPQWKKMAVIVIYDENSGFWDHVTPLKRDPQVGTRRACSGARRRARRETRPCRPFAIQHDVGA
jgi:phospholipase C